MPGVKKDTSRGFAPEVPLTPDIVSPAYDCLRLDGELGSRLLSPSIHQVLLGMARLRNAVSSFRIEGDRIELERARQVLDGSDPATGPELGVLKLARAYERLHRGAHPLPDVPGLVALHQNLFDGVLDSSLVGVLKQEQNYVIDEGSGRIRFTPTPPDRTEQELVALFTWFERIKWAYPPPVVAGTFFAEFQAIHPFADGNGRLGRYLNILVLKDLGLRHAPLVPFDTRLFRTFDNYYDKLGTTNSGEDYALWLRYYVRELRKAYELATSRADLREVLERFSKESVRAVLQWVLSGDGGWFRRGEYPNARGYSQPAIWSALDQLRRAEILEARGELKGRRYRLSPAFLARIYGRAL